MAHQNGNGTTSAPPQVDAVSQLLVAARHIVTQARLLAREIDPTLVTASRIALAHDAISDALDYRITHQ